MCRTHRAEPAKAHETSPYERQQEKEKLAKLLDEVLGEDYNEWLTANGYNNEPAEPK